MTIVATWVGGPHDGDEVTVPYLVRFVAQPVFGVGGHSVVRSPLVRTDEGYRLYWPDEREVT